MLPKYATIEEGKELIDMDDHVAGWNKNIDCKYVGMSDDYDAIDSLGTGEKRDRTILTMNTQWSLIIR